MVSGGSYFSQNSLTLYFGLGKSAKVDRIEVRWPAGETQSLVERCRQPDDRIDGGE